MKPLFECQKDGGCFVLTEAQAKLLFTDKDIEAGEKRGHLVSVGPWQLPLSYTALATTQSFEGEDYCTRHSHPLQVFGMRRMGNCRQSGYQLEGRVSIDGKKHRAFTSSALFQLPNGKLISCAIVHVCNNH